MVGLIAAECSRVDWAISSIDWPRIALTWIVAVAVHCAVGTAARIYRGRYWVGTVEEAGALAFVAGGSGTLLVALYYLTGVGTPLGIGISATAVASAAMVAARLVVRLRRERSSRTVDVAARRVVVFGAGEAGRQLIRSMLFEPNSGFRPVALLDDDTELHGRAVAGVRVLGGRADIERVAARQSADMLVLAVPSADASLTAAVAGTCMETGLEVKVLPPLSDLVEPRVGLSDLRDLDITDLLGRRPVETDLAAIAGYLEGKRVLVTGAGGSIGSELCRQLHRFAPAELMMLDRDESALHAVQLSIHGRALLDSPDVVLADIRDAEALRTVFEERRPEVVFHAAALKHLPMLEQYPTEAWKTNVLGTQNVVDAALAVGVDRFVNISTDKAANPTSVLGRSKRVGERLVASVPGGAHGPFLSVRFGNVLGSRGSVLTTFTDQILSGRPLTVTHPDVTRYFMTIPEAVELVLQAAAIGRPGEALVLDMGEPVRIADVARQLMDIAGRHTDIVFTGLRQGEKLHEELFGDGEEDDRPLHPAISHVTVPGLAPARLGSLRYEIDAVAAMTSISDEVAVPRRGMLIRLVTLPKQTRDQPV